MSCLTKNFKTASDGSYSQRHGNQRALDVMPGNDGSIVSDILSLTVIFHLQLIDSGHADSSMADKKRGKINRL